MPLMYELPTINLVSESKTPTRLVSTVLLDYLSYKDERLFETMVIPVDEDGETDYLEREYILCTTIDEAIVNHHTIVEKVKRNEI